MSRSAGYTLFLSPTETALDVDEITAPDTELRIFGNGERQKKSERAVLRMKLLGAKPRLRPVLLDELPGKVNYFLGNDRKKWRTSIPTYAKVRYQGVYPGVDLVYYGNRQQLEYDFVVAPGTDPGVIKLRFEGTDSAELDEHGTLIFETAAGELRLQKPVIYQQHAAVRQEISGRYVLRGVRDFGFEVDDHDPSKPLIIDPVLVYSTYLGGSGTESRSGIARDVRYADIAVDRDGNAYVTGNTSSADFPTANPLQSANAGSPDAFVLKLNPTGSALLYATYLGGSSIDRGFGIAVDAAGSAYVTGRTQSPNFPTANPLQRALGGNEDAFILKLDSTGSALLYSTYLGGSGQDEGLSIAVDAGGNAYVAGSTESRDRPTVNAFQPSFGGGPFDAYVLKLNPQGSALVYSTYLGGSGSDSIGRMAVDASGNAYVVGLTDSINFPTRNALQTALAGIVDAFVVKLNQAGSVVYSTYLGGSEPDGALAVAVDPSGDAHVAGVTGSKDFPVTPGALGTTPFGDDAFVAKLNASGTALIRSTYLGGSGQEIAFGIAVDGVGNSYIAGTTNSSNLPVSADAIQTAFAGGGTDAFLMKLDATGSRLLYSTYFGGRGEDTPFGMALDPAGSVYLTGVTDSLDFPVTSAAFQRTYGGDRADAFVVKISNITASPSLVTTVSGASFFTGGPLAPESIASGFAPGLATATQAATAVPLPTSLADTTVRVKDSAGAERLAPLFFVSPSQINYLIPPGTSIGSASVTVTNRDQIVATGGLQIEPVSPGVFAANGNGRDVAAALVVKVAPDGSQASQPVFRCGAAPGSCVAVPIDLGLETDQTILLLFGTGIRGRSSLSGVRVLVGNVDTEVLYAGPQPEFVGLDQVNVRLPRSLAARGEVDVLLMVEGRPTNPVRVSIK